MNKRGLTLLEVLISILIISSAIVVMFTVYPNLFEGVNLSLQKMQAWEIVKRQIETLKSTDFATLFAVSYDPLGGVPIANGFVTAGLANSRGVFYVERMRDAGGSVLTDLLNLEVVVCFRVGRRIIGEDQDLDGVLDSGEDQNNDNKISSPVTLRTLMLKPVS